MLRRSCLLMSAALITAGLSACDESGPTETGLQIGAGDDYVALGDSYTAAPLTGGFADRVGCFRSDTNYPHQVAEAVGADLTDVSCAGARTDSIIDQFETSEKVEVPPQISAISSSTDLVTVGMGANDSDLFGGAILLCSQISTSDPTGSPCADVDADAGDRAVAHLIAQMEDDLTARLEEISERAPDAIILVIGYPSIVPEEGTCDQLPLADGDYPFAREVLASINAALAAAASRADAGFVDVHEATEGHDICADDPWIAGIGATRGKATPWHPYPDEQAAVADLIITALG